MNSLINNLIRNGYLKSDLIIDAFSEISRIEFVPKEFEKDANADIALPIGYGQTISQPKTVAIMLELLDSQRGHNILDIGSGSGWTTALLCCIVGKGGRVTAVERIVASPSTSVAVPEDENECASNSVSTEAIRLSTVL